MKIALKKILEMKPVIEKLIQKDIDVLVAYDMKKIVDAVSKELEVYSATRKKLFDKYGEENKETKETAIPKEKVEAFRKDMEALLNKEVKLETPKIKLSKLVGVKLSTADVIIIDRLIER